MGRTDLGFIGLGLMGSAMAERLLSDDVTLHVCDPDTRATDRFRALGAVVQHTPKDVADHATIVFACLPSGAISQSVAFGPSGASEGSAIMIYVEMSTVGRPCVEMIAAALSAKGIAVVDAPISGGPKGARAGNLVIMAAGMSDALALASAWLDRIGGSIFIVDHRPGRAQVMKLINNLISAAAMTASYEALVMGAKAGLDPDLMVKVLNAGSARNSATLQKVPDAILTGTFDFGASTRTITKDVELGLAEAHSLGVPMWTAETVGQMWRFAMSQGAADDDYTTLIRFMEKWAGVEVRGSRARRCAAPD